MTITLRRLAGVTAALGLLLATSAFAQETEKAGPTPPPAGHPLAKIEKGMGQEQVTSILGQPTSRYSYRPGSAWIPWNYVVGRDQNRYEWYYKGKGVVIFNSRFWWSPTPAVLRVDYDPSEDGYH